MSERDALLFANEAFYRAFADGDFDAMTKLWASDAPVACIHPGWNPLFDLDAILGSWRAILNGPERLDIACHSPRPLILGAAGVVICQERLGSDLLAATNVFVQRGSRWLMVHHQAGPTAGPLEPDFDSDEEGGDLPPGPLN